MWPRKTNRAGVTYGPLVVLLAIGGAIGWLVWSFCQGRQEAAKAEARWLTAIVEVKALERAAWQYRIDKGTFPTNEQGVTASVEEAAALHSYIGGNFQPHPRDHSYAYRDPGEHSEGPEVLCYGADGNLTESAKTLLSKVGRSIPEATTNDRPPAS